MRCCAEKAFCLPPWHPRRSEQLALPSQVKVWQEKGVGILLKLPFRYAYTGIADAAGHPAGFCWHDTVRTFAAFQLYDAACRCSYFWQS